MNCDSLMLIPVCCATWSLKRMTDAMTLRNSTKISSAVARLTRHPRILFGLTSILANQETWSTKVSILSGGATMPSLQPVASPAVLAARRPTAVIVVMTAAALMDLLDVTVVNVALPTLRARLHATPTQLEWLVAGYLLAFGGTLIVWGRIGDVAGRRRVFLSAVAAFGAASLAAGVAPSIHWLIVFCVIQGAAAGALVPQVLATFRTSLEPTARTLAFGIYGAVAGLAAAAGVVLGGVLTQYRLFGLGWRAIFLVNVPLAAAVLASGLFVVPE